MSRTRVVVVAIRERKLPEWRAWERGRHPPTSCRTRGSSGRGPRQRGRRRRWFEDRGSVRFGSLVRDSWFVVRCRASVGRGWSMAPQDNPATREPPLATVPFSSAQPKPQSPTSRSAEPPMPNSRYKEFTAHLSCSVPPPSSTCKHDVVDCPFLPFVFCLCAAQTPPVWLSLLVPSRSKAEAFQALVLYGSHCSRRWVCHGRSSIVNLFQALVINNLCFQSNNQDSPESAPPKSPGKSAHDASVSSATRVCRLFRYRRIIR